MARVLAVPFSVRLMRTGNGAILLSLASNAYYGLNPVGLTIWEALVEEGQSTDELARSLSRGHRISKHEARDVVDEFVARLEGEGLLVPG